MYATVRRVQEQKLKAQGINDQDTIIFKDLGRQISWFDPQKHALLPSAL